MSWRWLKMPIFQKQVESLLEDKIGLSVKSVGHERIRHVVSQRMASCGMTDQNNFGRLAKSIKKYRLSMPAMV